MDKENNEHLIDKKIAEAKLAVAEKRLNLVLYLAAAALTIFGVLIPLLLTLRSEAKVDTAVRKMEQDFKELAGKQLRKPKIQCYVEGKPLVNSVIAFDAAHPSALIELKNVGDGTADFIKYRIYLMSEDNALLKMFEYGNWRSTINDKPEFKKAFENVDPRYDSNLPAQDTRSLGIFLERVNDRYIVSNIKATVLLRIFYGEPLPLDLPFVIEIRE